MFFLIILNSLFTDSLHFLSIFTHGHGFIQLFFNVMNRIKINNQVQLGLLIRSYLIQLILSCCKITIMLLNQNFSQVVKLSLIALGCCHTDASLFTYSNTFSQLKILNWMDLGKRKKFPDENEHGDWIKWIH